MNIYSYVNGNPAAETDMYGLDPAEVRARMARVDPLFRKFPKPPNPSTFYGAEGHFFVGGGLTSVSCTDECGKRQTYRFLKVCPFGAAIGASGGGGFVSGMRGAACKSDSYKGWFFETGLSLGPLSGGFDMGYNDDGSLSGVNEGSVGVGLGAKFKVTWCYYIPLD